MCVMILSILTIVAYCLMPWKASIVVMCVVIFLPGVFWPKYSVHCYSLFYNIQYITFSLFNQWLCHREGIGVSLIWLLSVSSDDDGIRSWCWRIILLWLSVILTDYLPLPWWLSNIWLQWYIRAIQYYPSVLTTDTSDISVIQSGDGIDILIRDTIPMMIPVGILHSLLSDSTCSYEVIVDDVVMTIQWPLWPTNVTVIRYDCYFYSRYLQYYLFLTAYWPHCSGIPTQFAWRQIIIAKMKAISSEISEIA